MSNAPEHETAAQRRARLDQKNEQQRIWRANRKQADSAPPITVGATRAGNEPAAAPAKRYTRAQRKAMAGRAANARAAKAAMIAAGIPLGKAKPERAAAALMHDKGKHLPVVPFERRPRVRGEILNDGTHTLLERIPNGHDPVDMGIVADLVLAIAARLTKR